MLVLDIFDNWIPASIVVDLITIPRGINNVQPQTDSIFLNDVRDRLNFGGSSYRLVGCKSSF